MEPTIAIAGLVGMLALVKTMVDYARTVVAWSQKRETVTAVLHRTLAYLAGVAAVFLYGASQLGDFTVPGTHLSLLEMNGWTKLIVGLSIGGLASIYTDTLKAVDGSDTQKVAPIVAPHVTP